MNVSYQELLANCFFSSSASCLASDSISSLVWNCPFSSASLESCFSSYKNRGGRQEERGGIGDRGGRQEERGGRQEERGGRQGDRGGRQEERGDRQEES